MGREVPAVLTTHHNPPLAMLLAPSPLGLAFTGAASPTPTSWPGQLPLPRKSGQGANCRACGYLAERWPCCPNFCQARGEQLSCLLEQTLHIDSKACDNQPGEGPCCRKRSQGHSGTEPASVTRTVRRVKKLLLASQGHHSPSHQAELGPLIFTPAVIIISAGHA